MGRVRVKICGISRSEDAVAAAQAGADAIGLVFYPSSPRAVDAITANSIIDALPPFINKVGLFVDAGKDFIESVLSTVALDMLQFHGEEQPADCEIYGLPYIKAIRMQDGVNLHEKAEKYASASGLLLDTYVKGVAGGTGQSFAWDKVPTELAKPVILAGGLTAENVGQAIKQLEPYAVDVSGGVESGKGIKDQDKIHAFLREVLAHKQ